ncbi:ABC transporter substrate-binding protein [Pseudonocardia asaccharolytica]|uniref:ABC transporter substrate-binding protein n=1 Tax=Pseudonocardia asaccharolytica TaxID=54010 RepID=UPI00040104E8|nr:ABC transporter substrate-binding protein [Pseudonocardia asaccharolytica]
MATLLTALSLIAATACGNPSGAGPNGPPDPNAVIRVANHLALTTWDPARSIGGPETQLLGLVYDRLVHSTPEGEPAPGAAESWTFENSGRTLLLSLRHGLRFSDGTALDAEVVKQNLDRARDLPTSTIAANLANIESVEVTDAVTVRISQHNPDFALPMLLADRPGMIANPRTFAQLDAAETPIGSGPFTVVAQQPSVSITLTKNSSFWDANRIKVGGAEIRVIPDPTARLNALRSGEVDLASLEAEQAEDARQLSELRVDAGPSLESAYIWLNPSFDPALADPNVRKAISYALDRNEIVNGVMFGEARPTAQSFPKGHSAYDDALDGQPQHDPTRARRLLADAGLPNGFSFEAVVYSPKMDRVAQAIQSQLAEVGITLTLRALPAFGSATEYFQKKSVDAAIFSTRSGLEPSLLYRQFYLPGQYYNPGNVSSDEVSGLIEKAKHEPSVDARMALYREIAQNVVAQPLGVIPVYSANQIVAHSRVVSGVRTWIDGFPHLDEISMSK